MTHASHAGNHTPPKSGMASSQYRRLGLMILLSFIAMYFLMYAMVNSVANVYMNVNQLYMAGLMSAPMVLIELVLMRMMYEKSRLNLFIGAAAIFGGVLCFLGIRGQAAVGKYQFLRSMIPHHASAILMCEQSSVQDAAIQRLCAAIVTSQRAEITEMKNILSANR